MRIVFNGQEYAGVDEMPPDVRRDYERTMALMADRDADGVPDALEASAVHAAAQEVTTTRVFVDGKEHTDPDRMPPEARRFYERLLEQMERDGPSGFAAVGAGRETGGVSREVVRRVVVTSSRTDVPDTRPRLHFLASPRRSLPVLLVIGVVAVLFVLFLFAG